MGGAAIAGNLGREVKSVKITIENETGISVALAESFSIEGATAELSAFHLVAAGLAMCTLSVLYSWAHQAGLAADDLHLHIEWGFGGEPYRMQDIDMRVHWPGLPEARRAAAARAAEQCTVHATLSHGTEVRTVVDI